MNLSGELRLARTPARASLGRLQVMLRVRPQNLRTLESNNVLHIYDQTAKPLLVKRRRSLRLPHAAHDMLSGGLATLHGATASRCWALPPTSFSNEVVHYHSRHKALGARGSSRNN